ncbi:Asp-tRNA(Asn)/Glu-tRNA(Gln) amidotransferase subunit GatC [Haladaptatus halobius]|uniref:Asp-tRNA(Asn)/Glu-tRNA(Gln) amidotransferase subunit GatC n=1 Tax=Haladaptatus halobius TaxID=2884875 RepID=UPI001D0AB1EF|nr:Asp-tRNA(Asn)/Glu-tRNA(Gln) amidotransferase subunit GatC [Haladaptatus halobius]
MSDTPPGPDEVRYIARLARVGIADAEAKRFAEQFADILGYFETLDEVPEIERESDLVNVMREDEVRDGLEQEEALKNAPESEEGYFKGPNVS